MSTSLQEYIQFLQRPIEDPPTEPELDDIDEKTDQLVREQAALSSGAIKKALLQRGAYGGSPGNGDLVYFHRSVKKEDGSVLESTRTDEGGSGIPEAIILGQGKRAPRGWELALQEMLKGERSAFRIDPEYSYAEKGCQYKPPEGMSKDSALVLDFQLVNWYSKDSVKPVGEDGVILRRVKSSDSWEHPRPPFEVEVSIVARKPSSSGRQGEGTPYFKTKTPLTWALGSDKTSTLFEEGIGSMGKGEKAFIVCPRETKYPENSLIPPPPREISRIEYEVELHSMFQVRDLTGTGEVTKRRVREGTGEFPIDCPLEDNTVRVHFKTLHPTTNQVYYDSRGENGGNPPLEFDTGVDFVPEAVDMCIRLMTPNELATVSSTPRYAYEGRKDKPPELPEDQDVIFEIELLDFDKTPHTQSMTALDKINRAEEIRDQGNRAFRLGRLDMAKQKYLKAMKLLDNAYDAEGEEQIDTASRAKTNCLTNLALIAQKQEKFTECFSWCEKALRENPTHAKALFRRGVNHVILGDYESAKSDFNAAKEADSTLSNEVDREILRMKQKQRSAAQKERDQFRNFYGRK